MKVIAELPRTGLANKLLIWSRAIVFAYNNEVKLESVVVYPWVNIPLRRIFSRDKRYYHNFFITNDLFERIKAFSCAKKIINPALKYKLVDVKVVCFQKIGQFHLDYFADIREYSILLREHLYKIVNPEIIKRIENEKKYYIAFHVRLGDFESELRTPIQYYVEIHKFLVSELGFAPITYVFSDGGEEQLKGLLELENVKIISGNSALYDLLLMSKAKLIVPAIRSTFSYYAAFISDAVIIRHRKDFCGKIKSSESEECWFSDNLKVKFFDDKFMLER